jgi:hypothetical protein
MQLFQASCDIIQLFHSQVVTSVPVTSEVVGSIPSQTNSSCDREGDSLRQRKFSPGAPVSSYIHYKSPNIVYRANNVLVDGRQFNILHNAVVSSQVWDIIQLFQARLGHNAGVTSKVVTRCSCFKQARL